MSRGLLKVYSSCLQLCISETRFKWKNQLDIWGYFFAFANIQKRILHNAIVTEHLVSLFAKMDTHAAGKWLIHHTLQYKSISKNDFVILNALAKYPQFTIHSAMNFLDIINHVKRKYNLLREMLSAIMLACKKSAFVVSNSNSEWYFNYFCISLLYAVLNLSASPVCSCGRN